MGATKGVVSLHKCTDSPEPLLLDNMISTEILCALSYGPCREKTCLRGLVNNKVADQPAHPCRLISAFVIHFLKSIISKLATSEFQFSSWSLWLSRLVCVSFFRKPRRQVFFATRPIRFKSGTDIICIFQLIQISINMNYLEKSCIYLEEYISSITG